MQKFFIRHFPQWRYPVYRWKMAWLHWHNLAFPKDETDDETDPSEYFFYFICPENEFLLPPWRLAKYRSPFPPCPQYYERDSNEIPF